MVQSESLSKGKTVTDISTLQDELEWLHFEWLNVKDRVSALAGSYHIIYHFNSVIICMMLNRGLQMENKIEEKTRDAVRFGREKNFRN